MEGGRGLAAAGVVVICGIIIILLILSLIFLIAYYLRPKGWKVITASLLNLLGILLYLVCELHKETYIDHQQVLFYVLLVVFILILFVGLFRDSKK